MRPAGLEPATCGLGNRRSIQPELRAQYKTWPHVMLTTCCHQQASNDNRPSQISNFLWLSQHSQEELQVAESSLSSRFAGQPTAGKGPLQIESAGRSIHIQHFTC